jgi:hypothetical protein
VVKKECDAYDDDDEAPGKSPANIAQEHDVGAPYGGVSGLFDIAVYSLMYLLLHLVLELSSVVLAHY